MLGLCVVGLGFLRGILGRLGVIFGVVGSSWGALGLYWAISKPTWCYPGVNLGLSLANFGSLRAGLGHQGVPTRCSRRGETSFSLFGITAYVWLAWAVLEVSCGILGLLGVVLKASWIILGPLGGNSGPSRGLLGDVLGSSWCLMETSWASWGVLGASWGFPGVFLGYSWPQRCNTGSNPPQWHPRGLRDVAVAGASPCCILGALGPFGTFESIGRSRANLNQIARFPFPSLDRFLFLVSGGLGVEMVLPSRRNAHFCILGYLGAILVYLGASWAILWVSWGYLGPSWGYLGQS